MFFKRIEIDPFLIGYFVGVGMILGSVCLFLKIDEIIQGVFQEGYDCGVEYNKNHQQSDDGNIGEDELKKD